MTRQKTAQRQEKAQELIKEDTTQHHPSDWVREETMQRQGKTRTRQDKTQEKTRQDKNKTQDQQLGKLAKTKIKSKA
jgi:hypothetical protein